MKTEPRKASIKDVAALAGVSIGSVSRVINKVDNVGPVVRERVLDAIATLDYRLDHAAQALRTRASHTVGCLFTDVGNPLYAKLFGRFEERLREDGYTVLLASGLNEAKRELEILGMFESRRMDGVIVAPGNERHRAVRTAVAALRSPTVILDRDMGDVHDQVLFDHVRGMKEAVGHLAALGHRDIGIVIAGTQTRPMRRRIEGFEAGLAAAGLAPDPTLRITLATSTGVAFDETRALMRRVPRPTALLALGTSALGDVLNAITAEGLRIPVDLSLVTLGEPDFTRSHQPALGSVNVDLDAVVNACVHLLLKRIRGQAGEARRRERIPTFFDPRGSCAPPLRTAGAE